jgi:hypothetical protein
MLPPESACGAARRRQTAGVEDVPRFRWHLEAADVRDADMGEEGISDFSRADLACVNVNVTHREVAN